MTTQNPTLTTVFSSFIGGALFDVHVAMPGRIESYDPLTGRATVKPLVKRGETDDGDRVVKSLAPIPEVPVLMPGIGDHFISLPVTKGDVVWLIFASCSLDRWIAANNAKEVDPLDDRRHHLSDAVAIPAMRMKGKPGDSYSDENIKINTSGLIIAGGDGPLVTRSEFLSHTHATAGLGTPSGPITGAVPPGTAVDFPGTEKLRG